MAILDDFDPDTAPAVMPVSVQRVTETGHPTRHLLNWETGTRSWYKTSIVNMNRRFTEVKDEIDGAYAAVTEETFARVTADEAIAGQILTVVARLGDTESAITEETLARSTADSALAGRLLTAETTLAGNTSSISDLIESVDGVSVRYGVTGYINGQTGGFVFTGALRNDGAAVYNMEFYTNVIFHGDVVLNGTITTQKAALAQFTQGDGAAAEGTLAGLGIVIKGGGTVVVIASFIGYAGGYFPINTPNGLVRIIRDGSVIEQVPVSFEVSGSSSNTAICLLQTTAIAIDTPGTGYHTYHVDTTNGPGRGGVRIAVIELAR